MAEQTQGVIAAARAAAPTAAQPAPSAPVTPAPVQQSVQQPAQGFGQPTTNGFIPQSPAPVAPVEPIQPAQPLVTDNDRTREQFQKILESNQRIATQNETLQRELQQLQKQREQSQQQFAPVQQVQPTTGQPSAMPKLSDYIEIDEQGNRYVNEAKFNAAVSDIYQKASRAEETVQRYVQTAEQREVARQESEAFASYPQLNPRGTSFDARLSQQTRAIIYDSLINPQDYGGRPLSFKDAADFVTRGVVQPATQVAVPTPAVNTENQVQKEQAAAAVQSVPQQMTQGIDQEREYQKLVLGTRTGSDEAIAVRLLNATHRMADVEQELATRR